MSCGHRHGSDLAWLWLWLWLAAAALIQPLTWELPYVMGAALKRPKKKKNQKKVSRNTRPQPKLFRANWNIETFSSSVEVTVMRGGWVEEGLMKKRWGGV